MNAGIEFEDDEEEAPQLVSVGDDAAQNEDLNKGPVPVTILTGYLGKIK